MNTRIRPRPSLWEAGRCSPALQLLGALRSHSAAYTAQQLTHDAQLEQRSCEL